MIHNINPYLLAKHLTVPIGERVACRRRQLSPSCICDKMATVLPRCLPIFGVGVAVYICLLMAAISLMRFESGQSADGSEGVGRKSFPNDVGRADANG